VSAQTTLQTHWRHWVFIQLNSFEIYADNVFLYRYVFQNYLGKNDECQHDGEVTTCNSPLTTTGAAGDDGRLESLFRLSCMLSPPQNATTSSCLEDSQSRGTSRHWRQIRSSSQLFSFYISLTLQAHLTEMLASRQEAIIVKRLVAREMHTLAEMCEATLDCVTQLDLLAPAIRGLFLIAYQGEGYAPDPAEEVDFDWSIPHSYYRILHASGATASSLSSSRGHSHVAQLAGRSGEDSDRIRVAFLSAYFFRHSVGRLMGNMILSLDKRQFHVTVLCAQRSQFGEGKKDDDLTQKLKKSVDEWIDLSHVFDKDVALIRGLGCDVLVFGDLLMHAFTAHLVSQRLAPLQVGFWGHPFSAGSPTIDYFISSDGFQESWHTAKTKAAVSTDYYEQVVLMDSFSANVLADKVYEDCSHIDDVFVQHHDLGSRAVYMEYVTSRGFDLFNRPYQHLDLGNETAIGQLHIYTCLQSIMKMHPLLDEILVGLLKQDPDAVIILLSSLKFKFLSQLKLQRRLLNALLHAEADPSRVILMPQISSTVYSQIVCGADVTLDPVPFGGGVTLSDSIRCNVPFVTSGEDED
jgi:hypothetical protein